MRALITGADGFVGSHVIRAFRDQGWKVYLFDAHDCWDRQVPVDVVVSLAASANPREALRDPAKAYRNGTTVMVDTLEFARSCGARVLHVSSNEVYGHKVGFPYEPRGPYAGAKACQEIVCETYQDVPVTIVVTQSLFGERQQPDKLVPTAIRKVLAGEPVQLQRNNARWASRPFLHARNLAEGLVFLAGDETGARRRVHVGAGRSLPLPTVVNTLAAVLGREALIEPVHAGDRPGHELDVEPVGCDVEGWQPTYGALTALSHVARWYRDNPRRLEPPTNALADTDSPYSASPREAVRAA